MDMLAGYGSESEEDRDLIDAVKQCVEQDLHQHHQQGPPEVQQQQQQQQQQHPEQQARVQLPPPDVLFDSAKPVHHVSNQGPSKRPFAAVTGHSLRNPASQVKTSKEHLTARPGAGAKAANIMLLPPQLRGRSNVVTEDLERLFTKKSSPAGKSGPSQ